AGVRVTHALRAEPPLHHQLARIFLGGLIFAALRSGPRSFAVGLTDDALLVLPLPRRSGDAGLTVLRGAQLSGVRLKRGVMRVKIDIDADTAHFRLRVPGATAHGSARAGLDALEHLCAQTQPA